MCRHVYPGNGFVDWIGIDIYQQTDEAFADDFDLFYTDFTAPHYAHKPLMVGENGSLPTSATGGVEQQYPYLLGFLTDASAGRYPRLKAYCYFEQGRDVRNWILDDAGGLDAMKVLGASPTFSPIPDIDDNRH